MQLEPTLGSLDYTSSWGVLGNGPVGLVCEDIALLLDTGSSGLLDPRDYEIKAVLSHYNSLPGRGEIVCDSIQKDLGYFALYTANSIQSYLDDAHAFPADRAYGSMALMADHYQFVSNLMLDSMSERARKWVSDDAAYLITHTPLHLLEPMITAMQTRFDSDCGWQFNHIRELLVLPLKRYESHRQVKVLRIAIDAVLKD